MWTSQAAGGSAHIRPHWSNVLLLKVEKAKDVKTLVAGGWVSA